jgi:aminoglycoside phosphotransferase
MVALSGYVDVGRAGIADRWRDLALCAIALPATGDRKGRCFSVPMAPVATNALEFYQLLDEFF